MPQFTYADSGKTVEVSLSKSILVKWVICLRGNATTGYHWTRAGFKDPHNLSDDTFHITLEYHADKPSSMVGISGEYIFKVTPLKKGEHKLVLIYTRPFDPQPGIDRTFEMIFRAK